MLVILNVTEIFNFSNRHTKTSTNTHNVIFCLIGPVFQRNSNLRTRPVHKSNNCCNLEIVPTEPLQGTVDNLPIIKPTVK